MKPTTSPGFYLVTSAPTGAANPGDFFLRNNGVLYYYNGSSFSQITTGGGGSFLPLAGGTMTGSITFASGEIRSTGANIPISLKAASKTSVGTSLLGGAVTIAAGDTYDGIGGNIEIATGNAVGPSGSQGSVLIRGSQIPFIPLFPGDIAVASGNQIGSATTAGRILFRSGDGTTGPGGDILFSTGISTSDNPGSFFVFTQTSNGSSGIIQIQNGNTPIGVFPDKSVSISASNGLAGAGNGGILNLYSGNSRSGEPSDGGAINIVSGNGGSAGGLFGSGGAINIYPGWHGSTAYSSIVRIGTNNATCQLQVGGTGLFALSFYNGGGLGASNAFTVSKPIGEINVQSGATSFTIAYAAPFAVANPSFCWVVASETGGGASVESITQSGGTFTVNLSGALASSTRFKYGIISSSI